VRSPEPRVERRSALGRALSCAELKFSCPLTPVLVTTAGGLGHKLERNICDIANPSLTLTWSARAQDGSQSFIFSQASSLASVVAPRSHSDLGAPARPWSAAYPHGGPAHIEPVRPPNQAETADCELTSMSTISRGNADPHGKASRSPPLAT
jgi:hypothetical protein